MSASLVGSEMCIRDRSRWAKKPDFARQLAAFSVYPLPTPVRLVQPRKQPVSYTHLTLPTICSV
eukprot:8935003-Alexandrium_andersonii.AAC.1